MEALLEVVREEEFAERPYIDGAGNNKVFATKGFMLTNGVDTFYAEMQGDLARENRDFHPAPNVKHTIQMQMSCRTYFDKDGNRRYQNDLKIIKFGI